MANEKRRVWERAYRRKYYLTLTGGKRIRLKWKRKFKGYCELCGNKKRRIVYHHWNYPEIGIYVCHPCHHFVEGIDNGFREKDYNKLVLKAVKEWELECPEFVT